MFRERVGGGKSSRKKVDSRERCRHKEGKDWLPEARKERGEVVWEEEKDPTANFESRDEEERKAADDSDDDGGGSVGLVARCRGCGVER
jgi:hypothetical protein